MSTLDPAVQERVNLWLTGTFDDAVKAEIRAMLDAGDATGLTDAFYKDLEFGTGGLRGIMGVGSNRINKYTIGMATQGLANYLKKQFPGEKIRVVVAHDSRNNGPMLADVTANVFSSNGFDVFYFSALRPTPQLSFAIRELKCHSGVMLTASHNPKEYNGYKAYWNDGGQLIAPHDKNVVEEVQKIRVEDVDFKGTPSLIHRIGTEMDTAYLNRIVQESLSPDAIKRQHDLKIVFSPIHGTGITLVPAALKQFGFTNVSLVDEQITPDGNFPTVVYPNPEEHEALTLSLKKAKAIDADLVLATDPDADRVGIAIKDNKGQWMLLNGNQTGVLLMNYVLTAWKNAGKLDGRQYVVKTIVTSFMMDAIAASMHVPCYNVLTGFKFIGAMMTANEGKTQFVVGGEESYGYLVGEHARDKDAVISCVMIAEMAAYYKDQGRTLFEVLLDLYVEHGCYREKLVSLTKKGKAGADEIKAMMERFRANPPQVIGGAKVTVLKDYTLHKETDFTTGAVTPIDLPKSDVLQFITSDGDVISARPSGTEPKIKFYCSVKGKLQSRGAYEDVSAQLEAKVDAIMKDLGVA
jgi:phosphoglucomutase